jgi:alkanesulfonate monooxygenase SsuD/methylene tetrahydromethanopterin reductase-like flavin-dependent oxidoreductase (luciferase family)
VEARGFGELWLSEDYFYLGGFTSSAMALQATSHIPVGVGIISAVARHPAVTAMEIATLANAYPGRFIPGIGHGFPLWTKQMGLYPKSILSVLRETVTSVRRLLDGETITAHDGHFHFDRIVLHHPVSGVELMTGVTGPKSLELSGEVADGTVLSVCSSPDYVKYAGEITARGAAKAGRTEPHKLPTFAFFKIDENRDVARAAARGVIAFLLSAAGPTPLTAPMGINDVLTDMIARGGMETVAQEMPEEWIDELAIAGEPDECAGRIKAFLDAGATSIVLTPLPGDDVRGQIEMAVRHGLQNA